MQPPHYYHWTPIVPFLPYDVLIFRISCLLYRCNCQTSHRKNNPCKRKTHDQDVMDAMWRTMYLQEGVQDFHRSFFRKIGFDWCENWIEMTIFINACKSKRNKVESLSKETCIHKEVHVQSIAGTKMIIIGHVVVIASNFLKWSGRFPTQSPGCLNVQGNIDDPTHLP